MATAIIVAGGSGVRMNAALRKQYISIDNMPILCRTILPFGFSDRIEEIVLVVPENDVEYCRQNVLSMLDAGLKEKIILASGGKERQASVYNGLLAVSDREGIVCIHDGVRPFVQPSQIDACVDEAQRYGASILATPASDTRCSKLTLPTSTCNPWAMFTAGSWPPSLTPPRSGPSITASRKTRG